MFELLSIQCKSGVKIVLGCKTKYYQSALVEILFLFLSAFPRLKTGGRGFFNITTCEPNDLCTSYKIGLLIMIDYLASSSGPTSMPTGRPTPSSHYSEFKTFAGGNYRGAPNGPNSYPHEQYGIRQDQYIPSGPGVRDGYPPNYEQHPVRHGAQQPAPPTSNGGTQEVPRPVANQQPKPAIKSREELGKLRLYN